MRLWLSACAIALAMLLCAPDAWSATWTAQQMAVPVGSNGSLVSASCRFTGTACVAVGSALNATGDGATLVEASSGSSWRVQPTPSPAGALDSDLTGVSCVSSTACIAVGLYSVVGSPSTTAFAEVWTGARWAIQRVPVPAGTDDSVLNGVSCTAVTACTAVGNWYGTSPPGGSLVERWNGTTWTIQSDSFAANLNSVWCATSTVCTAVGSYYDSNLGKT